MLKEQDKVKLTKRDFEFFKEECLFWLDYYGLKTWETGFYWGTNLDEYDIAISQWSSVTRRADFYLNPTMPANEYDNDIAMTAFHEVTHIVLGDFQSLAVARYNVSEEEMRGAVEGVVHTLTNTLYREVQKWRKRENKKKSKGGRKKGN